MVKKTVKSSPTTAKKKVAPRSKTPAKRPHPPKPPPPPPPPPPPKGKVVGRKYELAEIAGTGGMANVWRATMSGPGRFKRTVAVKHMHPHLKNQRQYRDMFFEEARVGAELQDSNIVQVYDFFEERDQYYIVMEWIEGINLATYIQYVNHVGAQTRWELVTAVGIGVLRGLAAAHERINERGHRQPILHRDVSPHNVLISVKGPAKLIDFGLALATDRLSAPTPPDVAKGKLLYMAPELLKGQKATHLSDIFSVGNLLWETLVGRKLFAGESDRDVFNRITRGQVEALEIARPDTPIGLRHVIEKSLQLKPKNRFSSAREMALELGNVLKTSNETRNDFYQLLAQTVLEARAKLRMGRRTQAPFMEGRLPTEESEIGIKVKGKAVTRQFLERITSFMR